ncbi:MAG: hypothetical protein ACR2MS_09905 [Weeksellaceae bacterium]
MAKLIAGVPDQKEGGFHDTESEKCFETVQEATTQYPILKTRLLNINSWHSYAGSMSAAFKLFDSKAQNKNEAPEVGDYIRIDIPGMGSKVGDSYDWVKITKIDLNAYDADERCFIQCVPSINPTSNVVDEVAHFYLDKATSNFIVSRRGSCITTGIYGRNEVTNDDVNNLSDKLRNALISIGGMVGVSKLQWKSLANGLLNF